MLRGLAHRIHHKVLAVVVAVYSEGDQYSEGSNEGETTVVKVVTKDNTIDNEISISRIRCHEICGSVQ